ncbi:serine protease [Maritimibacter sp. 55A14]|uniref:trypsin-like peptidase domain-containing protein n=1 Tax=Maritimibacter sp. 55A14 TaxID=2174844 RepID=UPI000D6085F0|nr:trypsin-like peptidase domain-containing protein [Maritimibacter sp. 55A14]PWE32719.1 serine protease [Maritimibacter sp. 55A14]
MPLKRIPAAFAALVIATAACAEIPVPQSPAQISLSFAPVVREVTPAVVNIYAKRVVAARRSPFADDPFFEDFFRNFGRPTPRVQNSLGSGVILSPDGLVVSNYHVVGQATEIRVVLNDRREYEAEVLLGDKEADLAVLRLKGAEGLPALALRDSDSIEVGDLVLAVGNPFGIGQTVSSGIISGLARSGLFVGNARGYFIQTDAAINPGNSGGALVDIEGRLVGVNTAILSRSGGSNGIGFAIPSNLVARFLDQARAGARDYTRPWAGMSGQAVDADLAIGLGLAEPRGMVVSALHPESPFAAAGLATGDVVVAIDEQPVNSPHEMLFRLSARGIGNVARVAYLRDGARRVAELRLIPPPETPARDPRTIAGETPLQGLNVSNINPAVIAETGLPLDAAGVLVTGVDGFVRRTGLRPGDILLEINTREIATTADAERAAHDMQRTWELRFLRDGRAQSVRFRI